MAGFTCKKTVPHPTRSVHAYTRVCVLLVGQEGEVCSNGRLAASHIRHVEEVNGDGRLAASFPHPAAPCTP